jgi:hypothetical protein
MPYNKPDPIFNSSFYERPSKAKRKYYYHLLILIIFLLGILLLVYIRHTKETLSTKMAPKSFSRDLVSIASVNPKPVIIPSQGIITKINQNSITYKTASSSASFEINKQTDLQKLISGSIAKGDAKTEPAKFENLKANQEIFVVFDPKTPKIARSILILK